MLTNLNADRTRALKLLSIYNGSVDDFFKFWPEDKHYFFSTDFKAFLAYRVQNQVAVCLGDPVGHDGSIENLLINFKSYCQQHKYLIIFIQTNSKYLELYRNHRFNNLLIGSDAVIDLDIFFNKTIHNKYFRNIVNRFEKNKFELKTYLPPHSKKVISEVSKISKSWLTLPHRKEWSFLTGKLNEDYLNQVPLFILYNESRKPLAFINQLPSNKPGVATIDLMRHLSNSPPNSMDYLFISFMKLLYEDGYKYFNLGMSPLDGSISKSERLAIVLRQIYKLNNKFIGFKGLHQYKSKYKPAWEPRYVIYQGKFINLPKYAYAIYKLMTEDN